MFCIADAAFSYERELIVCSYLQNFCKGKGSRLQFICIAHTAGRILFVDIKSLQNLETEFCPQNENIL